MRRVTGQAAGTACRRCRAPRRRHRGRGRPPRRARAMTCSSYSRPPRRTGRPRRCCRQPVGVPSGVGSLQVPRSYLQHRTRPSLPHVERAAQRLTVRFNVSSRQSDFRSRFRKWTTHRTYSPWFFHGTTVWSGCSVPSQGHAAVDGGGDVRRALDRLGPLRGRAARDGEAEREQQGVGQTHGILLMVRAWLFGRNARAVPRRKARDHRAGAPEGAARERRRRHLPSPGRDAAFLLTPG
jgi:hypothetical protein